MERSTICSWVNPLFLWPCSIAFCMFTRQGTYIYPLVMTNSLPWKDPPFLRTVNHLFLWVISHGYVTNNQRVNSMKPRLHVTKYCSNGYEPILKYILSESETTCHTEWNMNYLAMGQKPGILETAQVIPHRPGGKDLVLWRPRGGHQNFT